VIGLTDVVAVAMGTGGLSHALAVRSDGTVWSWGDNGSGKLGNGSAAPFSETPVQVTGLNLN
jgi:alpha-tubulin suppressor-like RCC1 family protein